MSAQEENVGFVTRHFLRRLAIARRMKHDDPRTAFVDAKVEVILVFLVAPLVGVLSFAVAFSLHWFTPAEVKRIPLPSKYIQAVVLLSFCYIVGSLWLDRKFKRYRSDPTPCLQFDTERDRKIVEWQKLFAYIAGGGVMPLAGLVIGFWPRFHEHLFQ